MLVKGATGENALPFRSLAKHIGHTVPLCVEFFLVLYVARQFMSILNRVKIKRISGPRLNLKNVLSTYGDFHVKDKTAVRTSYL